MVCLVSSEPEVPKTLRLAGELVPAESDSSGGRVLGLVMVGVRAQGSRVIGTL